VPILVESQRCSSYKAVGALAAAKQRCCSHVLSGQGEGVLPFCTLH